MPVLESAENKAPSLGRPMDDSSVYRRSRRRSGPLGVSGAGRGERLRWRKSGQRDVRGALSGWPWVAQSTEPATPRLCAAVARPGPVLLVSTGGGTTPFWRGGSKEIFYKTLDNRGWRSDLDEVGYRRTRCPRRNLHGPATAPFKTARGQRFLVNTPTQTSPRLDHRRVELEGIE